MQKDNNSNGCVPKIEVYTGIFIHDNTSVLLQPSVTMFIAVVLGGISPKENNSF